MTQLLTPSQLSAIREREAKSSKGPWRAEGGSRDTMGYYIVDIASGDEKKPKYICGGWCSRNQGYPPDVEFIAMSREAIPALLADREELVTALNGVREALESISYAYPQQKIGYTAFAGERARAALARMATLLEGLE